MPSVKLLFTFLITVLVSCSKSTTEPAPSDTMYFPSNTDTSWERKSLSTLGWNSTAAQSLKDYLVQKNTKSFMILVNGRIVMEEYFNGHSPVSTWQWNSAGKTLAATTTGIAQQEGLLQITQKASQYLGAGWTLEPIDKENLINIRHLLTMTSGINDASDLVIRPNLTYLADAGTRWSYHNVFQKLMDIVAAASGQDFETYFNNKLKNKIGMEGFWNFGVIYKIYHSNTRSMARFGLLALNKGKWNNEQVVNEPFFNESTSSSQSLNPSYGYLWWLNGKSGAILPGSQTYYPGTLIPNAPPDMYAAMGAEDQRIYVVPSKKMVVIRMGDAANPATPNFALSGFDNEFWGKLNAVIN
jgi:CubicO group peptidase (beta-lactamase class C family)